MRCVGCGSAAVTRRPERTARGYCRFRCRHCHRQFNERSTGQLSAGGQFASLLHSRFVHRSVTSPSMSRVDFTDDYTQRERGLYRDRMWILLGDALMMISLRISAL